MMIFPHLKDDIGVIRSRCRVGYNHWQRLVHPASGRRLNVGGAEQIVYAITGISGRVGSVSHYDLQH
jgi:hypothetical protein